MADRTCPECGETKPVEQFWGERRQRMKVCTACRRKAARHKRYLKDKATHRRAEIRRLTNLLMQEQRAKVTEGPLPENVREINNILSRIDYKLGKYVEKLNFGQATKRTELAIKNQSQRKAYFLEIKELLMEAAGKGFDRPLEYYLSNTYLLHKHGFPCVVVDADPRLEMETEDADH
jgi:hypothetical protein